MIPPLQTQSSAVPVRAGRRQWRQVTDGGVPIWSCCCGALHRAGSEPVAHSLHPVDAVVNLMQETLDAERFGAPAVRLATLAASTHCVELTVGTPEETADAIETLFRLDPPEPLDVTVLPPSDAFFAGVVSIADR